MKTTEVVWCTFCQDRPAIGRMVIMKDESREQLGVIEGLEGAACDLHGREWTGTPVATDETNGEVAVLQYVHPDYQKVTEQLIEEFSGDQVCAQCGDPIEPMPIWVADRILRAHPRLVLDKELKWEGLCQDCGEAALCDCDGETTVCSCCGEEILGCDPEDVEIDIDDIDDDDDDSEEDDEDEDSGPTELEH